MVEVLWLREEGLWAGSLVLVYSLGVLHSGWPLQWVFLCKVGCHFVLQYRVSGQFESVEPAFGLESPADLIFSWTGSGCWPPGLSLKSCVSKQLDLLPSLSLQMSSVLWQRCAVTSFPPSPFTFYNGEFPTYTEVVEGVLSDIITLKIVTEIHPKHRNVWSVQSKWAGCTHIHA